MSDSLVVHDFQIFRDKNELLEKYQNVFVRSLITSFGLDFIFFNGLDQEGGTVDTVNNARQGVYSNQYDNESKYKQHIDSMGPRFNRDSYNQNEKFIEKGREYKQDAKDGVLVDGYTGGNLSSNDKFDREHIVSALEIEKDPGRVLADIEGDKVASIDSNLTPVNSTVNRSKGSKSVDEYTAWLAENKERHLNELKILEEKGQSGSLSDKERKHKERLKHLCSVDESLMREKDKEARHAVNRKINLKYYLGKDFVSQTGKEAFKAGWRMGVKQALGVVFLEVWKAVRAELPHIVEEWRSSEGWSGKFSTIRPIWQHAKEAISNAIQNIKSRWKDVFNEAKDGFFSGALSSLTTTIINIFEKTELRFMRLLRNFWSSIIGALQIMKGNHYATRDEKTLAVMRLLSVAAAGILQPVISECVEKFLFSSLPVGGPMTLLKDVVSEFAGVFCSGIISVTLVYFIDKSPIVQKILAMGGDVFVNAVNVVGKGIGLTVAMLKAASRKYMDIMVSPAARCLNLACFPLMEAAMGIKADLVEQKSLLRGVDGKLDEQSAAMADVGVRLEGLQKQVGEGFADLKKAMEAQTHILEGLITTQGRQLTDMIEALHQDMQEGFADIRNILESDRNESESLQFHQRMNMLLLAYQACVETVMTPDGTPRDDDLKRVIDAAYELVSWLESRLQGPFKQVGDPRRLPFLSAYVLAVQLEVDTRRFLDGEQEPCQNRRMALSSLLKTEVEKLSEGKLFELAGKERSFLVEQYVLLHRAVKQSVKSSGMFQLEVGASDSSLLANPELFVWDDGLAPVRQAMEIWQDASSGAEPERLVNHQDGEESAYGDGSVSAFKEALGIPQDRILTAGAAFGLFCEVPKIKKARERALRLEFAA